MPACTGARVEGAGDSGLLVELVVSGGRRPARRDREAREETSKGWGRGRGGRGAREEIEGRWGSSEEMDGGARGNEEEEGIDWDEARVGLGRLQLGLRRRRASLAAVAGRPG